MIRVKEWFKKSNISSKLMIIFLLSAVICCFAGGVSIYKLRTYELRKSAENIAQQALAFREWAAGTGLVWVNELHPDFQDFLMQKKAEDGSIFYGKNPTLVTREFSQVLSKMSSDATFRVTSDNYRHPANKPDPFELEAIRSFQKEQKPFIETFAGDLYRYSIPLKVTQACLKCHGFPEDAPRELIEKYGREKAFGYKVGDIRGVLTVNMSVTPLLSNTLVLLNPYTLGLLLLAFAVNFFLVKKLIVKRIIDVSQQVKMISEGDYHSGFSTEEECDYKDEICRLNVDISAMAHSISNTINGILSMANNVSATVETLKESAETTVNGAKEQSLQASQIAAAAEEMSHTLNDIAKNTSDASETSANAMQTAEKGKAAADSAVETVNRVHTSAAELGGMVDKLHHRTSEIGDIVTIIENIADQTNLLALNAAIEAARAGDHGRGFAVVADEVRKLAEKIIKATSEISEKINGVQAESRETAKSMEETSNEVSKATENINEVGEALLTIVEEVQKVRDQVTQIAVAVEQQSVTSEDVAQNTEKTSNIAQETEKLSNDVIEKIQGLNSVIEEMNDLTKSYSTGAVR